MLVVGTHSVVFVDNGFVMYGIFFCFSLNEASFSPRTTALPLAHTVVCVVLFGSISQRVRVSTMSPRVESAPGDGAVDVYVWFSCRGFCLWFSYIEEVFVLWFSESIKVFCVWWFSCKGDSSPKWGGGVVLLCFVLCCVWVYIVCWESIYELRG